MGNLTVFGTQSVQYITSSQLNVANNVINVNVGTPGVRFGGLSVYDSGSQAGATGSLFWDSQNNNWIYQQVTGSTYTGGMLISGPRNTSGIGNEQGTTSGSLMKGMGGDHITSSAILEDGYKATFYGTSLVVSSSGNVGIGTTTPTSGSLQIYNNNGTNHIALNGGSYPNTYLGSFSGGTYFANNYFYAAGHASDNATKRSMEFYMSEDEIDINTMPAGSPGTRTRVMTISGSQGNIGIGNTTPQAKIHIGPSFNTVPASTSIAVAGDTSIRFMAGSDGNANYGSYIAGSQTAGVRALSLGYRQGAGDVLTMTVTQISDGIGGVGIGTSVPTSPLTVRASSRTDTLRLSISGSSSVGDAVGITFGSATYDKAQIIAYNENAGNAAAYLVFKTGGSPATTDVTEHMRITSGGQTNFLHSTTNQDVIYATNGSASPYGMNITFTAAAPNNTTNNFIYLADSSGLKCRIVSNGSIYNSTGTYGPISDIKFKENIIDATAKLDDILKLKVRNFNLIGDETKQIGFVAQEFEEVFPNMVDNSKDKETGDEYKAIKMSILIPILTKAIQELSTKLDQANTKIAALEAK
jgi:hypothetical protein